MSQLSLTFHFPPSAELAGLGSGNSWCHSTEDLAAFESAITKNDAWIAVGTEKATRVSFEFGDV